MTTPFFATTLIAILTIDAYILLFAIIIETTSLRILAGDEVPSAGTATLNGVDILTNAERARGLVGWCPQTDPLIGKMSAREHLQLYAALTGVHEGSIEKAVDDMIERIGLSQYQHKPAETYSGGNKRKLSVGVSCWQTESPVVVVVVYYI